MTVLWSFELLNGPVCDRKKGVVAVLSQMGVTVATTEGEKHEKCWRPMIFVLILQCETNKTTIHLKRNNNDDKTISKARHYGCSSIFSDALHN